MKQEKHFYSMLSGDTDKLFSWKTLGLSVVGLFINIVLANLVISLKLPLYIDNVGSVLVGALAGPIPGMTVGFLSNVINSFGDPITMYYGILTIIMAMLASIYTQKGFFRKCSGVIRIIFSFIFIGGGVGSIMTWLLYGGGIGGIGAPLANYIHSFGISAFFSQLIADIIIDIPDKTITVLLVIILLKVCSRLFPREFPLSLYYSVSSYNEKIEEKTQENFYRKYSVKTLILRLIIACSTLISIATILISYFMYCNVVFTLNERLIYLIQLISVSFAITLMICAVTIWVATKRISDPVNRIVKQSRKFREIPSQEWLESDVWKNRSPIETGDEIEELYHAICAEQETVANNVIQMKKTEEKLRHSKELEDALANARQASQAKGQFLSRMSHEIRTPLNAVIGYLDIAKMSLEQPNKILHCIENGEIAAKHLLSIINDVLDISSIESGKMKIACEKFNLDEQITTIATLFSNQCEEKRVYFDVKVEGLTYQSIIGDYLRMNQIFMNLLSNAVKFTPEEGRVSFHITQMNRTPENIFLKFVIQDTGIGMSEEFRQRLFTPFEQESATTAQKYGGTGLGLSITANLVSMMGGAIDVKSVQGKGSTFTVTLPFQYSDEDEKIEEKKTYSKLRALVVGKTQQEGKGIKELLKSYKIKSDILLDSEGIERQVEKRENTQYAYDFCIMEEKVAQNKIDIKIPILVLDYENLEQNNEISTFLISKFGKYDSQLENEKAGLSLKGMKVLLAEDNEMNREIAVNILEKAKMVVDSAENGKEALEKFEQNPDKYQAILMDIQMPIMDGYEAAKAIRALNIPQAKTILIIAMTANAFHEDVAAALASGMNEHISKPIDYQKLFEVLKRFQDKS